MKRQLLSLPIISDQLCIYKDGDGIAELLGASLQSENQPNIFFFTRGVPHNLSGMLWSTPERKFYIMEYSELADNFKIEDDSKEIEELKAANKTLGETGSRVMKERDTALWELQDLKLGFNQAEKETIHKDLLLEIVAATHGKKLN
jgi:hypothetical protein